MKGTRPEYDPLDADAINLADAAVMEADDVADEVRQMAKRRLADAQRIRALVETVLDAADAMSPLPDHPNWRGAP